MCRRDVIIATACWLLQRLSRDVDEKLNASLNRMEYEMKAVYEIGGLPHFQAVSGQVSHHVIVTILNEERSSYSPLVAVVT